MTRSIAGSPRARRGARRSAAALVASSMFLLAAPALAAEQPDSHPRRSPVFRGVTFQAPASGSDAPARLPRLALPTTPAPFEPLRVVTKQTAAPAVAIEYSEGYHTRARIHRIASYATLPLFATQGFLGQSLYDDASPGKKTAHQVVAASIGGLFAVNSITGVWNLVEARKDPERRAMRWTHGLLMLGADAGFLATALLAPDDEGTRDRSTHRAVAFTSIAVATTGYLIMLFGNR